MMMSASLLNAFHLVGLITVFAVVVFVARKILAYLHVQQETERKIVHVIAGVCLLPMPWLFSQLWPVLLLMGVIALGPLLLPLWPRVQTVFGRAMNVSRQNMGVPLFAVSFLLLFALTGQGQRFCYVSAVLVMVFADAVAAVVGTQFPLGRFRLADTSKSLTGSAAFFATSCCCIALAMSWFTTDTLQQQLDVALIVSGIATSLEALSFAGLDNLLVPLSVFYLLQWLS